MNDEIREMIKVQCKLLDQIRISVEKIHKKMEGHTMPMVKRDPDVSRMWSNEDKQRGNSNV